MSTNFVLRACLALSLVVLSLGTSLRAATISNCTQQALFEFISQGGKVTFLADCTLTFSNTMLVTTDVELDAAGFNVVFQGSTNGRLFTVRSGARLTFRGITLSGGRSPEGGALFIESEATVVATNCVFAGNRAAGLVGLPGSDGGGEEPDPGIGEKGEPAGDGLPGFGGAIFNVGTAVLQRCRFLTNSAAGGAGGSGGDGGDGAFQGGDGASGGNGAVAFGGAIFNTGDLVITNCAFEANSAVAGAGGSGGATGEGAFPGYEGDGGAGAAAAGGAVYSTVNFVAVNSTFSSNVVTGGSSAAAGQEYSGNGANGLDGGLARGGAVWSVGDAGATNCTFFANTATGGGGGNGGASTMLGGKGGDGGNAHGGAIFNSGNFDLLNCTVVTNAARGGTNGLAGASPFPEGNGRVGTALGGGLYRASGDFFLQNSIVSSSPSGGNGWGTFADLGNNISSDTSIALGMDSLKSTNPRLGPLTNNGGPTLTLLPRQGSAAIEGADPTAAPAFDQRGFARPGAGKTRPDIGSTELTPVFVAVSPTNQVVTIGQSATFTVVAGGDAPFRYLWSFEGTPITGATNSSYTISSVSTTNAGVYSVLVTNLLGSATASATLQVALAPVIVSQPTNQTVQVGGVLQMAVGAVGVAPLSYQWRTNGVALPLAVSANSALVISNVQPSHAGSYTVVITNIHGAVTSTPAIITVGAATNLNLTVVPSSGGTNFGFVVPSQPGLSYVTESNTNLTATNWVPVQTNAGTGNLLTNIFPTSKTNNGFFRLRIL